MVATQQILCICLMGRKSPSKFINQILETLVKFVYDP